jgi:hypothetical protein
MMIAENDIELLEEYLDGALEDAATASLTSRLAVENPLAEALTELQAQRALRAAAFKTMEPNEVTAQQLMWRVRGAMQDQDRKAVASSKSHWSQWNIARVGSAAAACMVFGFLLGRLAHINPDTPGASTIGMPVKMTSHNESVVDNSSKFTPVGSMPRIMVPVSNEYGKVVAWQTFDNPDQAKSFTEDLNGTRSTQAPANSPQPKLVDSPQQN